MKNARFDATKKAVALVEALEAFGVDVSLVDVVTGEGYVGVRVNTWNCVDGSNIPVTFALMENDDYAGVEVIAEPESQIKKLLS